MHATLYLFHMTNNFELYHNTSSTWPIYLQTYFALKVPTEYLQVMAYIQCPATCLSFVYRSGYAAGYVASSFYLGRFLSSYYFGYLSDHVGRKPVMIVSMSAVGILSLGFGVSETLVWAVSCR